jgi:predicted PurR-regulated permease PerM
MSMFMGVVIGLLILVLILLWRILDKLDELAKQVRNIEDEATREWDQFDDPRSDVP